MNWENGKLLKLDQADLYQLQQYLTGTKPGNLLTVGPDNGSMHINNESIAKVFVESLSESAPQYRTATASYTTPNGRL